MWYLKFSKLGSQSRTSYFQDRRSTSCTTGMYLEHTYYTNIVRCLQMNIFEVLLNHRGQPHVLKSSEYVIWVFWLSIVNLNTRDRILWQHFLNFFEDRLSLRKFSLILLHITTSEIQLSVTFHRTATLFLPLSLHCV